MKSKVVVVIPSYNSEKHWPDLMPKLVAEKYDSIDIEILVVDNNSSDNSVAFLKQRYPEVTVIQNDKNIGFVGANNVGYEHAKDKGADFILLLNDDTVVTQGFIQKLHDFIRRDGVGSVQPKILLWPDREKINTLGNVIHFLGFGYGTQSNRPDKLVKSKKINYASGSCALVSMKALNKLGGLFDETMFMYLEDLELGWQLKMFGYENYLVPESVIYHKYSFNKSMRQYKWFERNRLWVMVKNYKLGTLILLFPAFIIMELGQMAFAVFNGRLLDKLVSYTWLLSIRQWSILLKKRKFVQKNRVLNDRQTTKSFAGTIKFQELNSIPLKIANVFFGIYWHVVKIFIFW